MDILFNILENVCRVLIYLIVIRVVLSWFVQRPNMLTILLDKIVEPILYPLRRIIPRVGMMDFSPLAAILLLQLIIWLINRIA
ncbi:YggT family protein [Chloroflexota bacterium]